MKILSNERPLHQELLLSLMAQQNVREEDQSHVFRTFDKLVQFMRESRATCEHIAKRWPKFEDVECYLAVRLICAVDLCIYPSKEFSEEEVEWILQVNEVTYLNLGSSGISVFVDKNGVVTAYRKLVDFKTGFSNSKRRLKEIKPMRLVTIDDETTNHDLRIEEILEGYEKKKTTNKKERHIKLYETDHRMYKKEKRPRSIELNKIEKKD